MQVNFAEPDNLACSRRRFYLKTLASTQWAEVWYALSCCGAFIASFDPNVVIIGQNRAFTVLDRQLTWLRVERYWRWWSFFPTRESHTFKVVSTMYNWNYVLKDREWWRLRSVDRSPMSKTVSIDDTHFADKECNWHRVSPFVSCLGDGGCRLWVGISREHRQSCREIDTPDACIEVSIYVKAKKRNYLVF